MQEDQPHLLSESLFQQNTKPRKELLPWWIKFFSWIFLILGAIVLLSSIPAAFGQNIVLSIYGLESNTLFSIIGSCIFILFTLKGITAFGLISQKEWAINLGIVDAIAGICICLFLMIWGLINTDLNSAIRLELLLLVPYLLRLLKIKSEWENRVIL